MDKEPEKAETGEDDREQSNWASDQQKHDYYYDDSHGYEVFQPDEEDDEENELDEN